MRQITWGTNEYLGLSDDDEHLPRDNERNSAGPVHSRLSSLSQTGTSPRQALANSRAGVSQAASSSNFTSQLNLIGASGKS